MLRHCSRPAPSAPRSAPARATAQPCAPRPQLTLRTASRAPVVSNLVKRSFATEKPAGKPAGKPGAAAPAAGGKAAAGPPNEDAGIPPPPPSPAPKAPADPTNPLHPKYPGMPLSPPGTIPEHVQKIAEAIARLNMLEAAQLNVLLQQQLGITEEQVKGWFGAMAGGVVYAAPPGGAAGAPAAGGAAPAAAKEEKKEKTAFNLKLVKIEESQKIKILKEIRVLRPGMNLAETKALTDKLPSILKESVAKEEAEGWVKKLKEVGATVELE